MFDASNNVASVRVVHPEMVAVTYKKEDGYVDELPNSNPIIAAFVTCYARLKLYSCLEPLGDRVLYMDTGQFMCVWMCDIFLTLSCCCRLGDLRAATGHVRATHR